MKPKTLSASSLDTAKGCLARFKAENIDYVPRTGNTNAADVGTSVHAALEAFVKSTCITKKEPWDLDALVLLYRMYYAKVFDTSDEKTDEFKDGLSLIKKWFKRTDLSGVEVLSVETKTRIPVPTSVGPIPFTYIWDRCDRFTEDGKSVIRVVDYKGLDRDTLIATPYGWSTMGKLQEGDEVFSGKGSPCKVVHKSEIHNRNCYKISFDDGTSIVCDDEHRWEVRYGAAHYKTGEYKHKVMTPLEMLARGLKGVGGGRQNDIAVETTPIFLTDADLPIDPYVFGAWIGDGHSYSGSICKPLPALFEEIESRGYKVGEPTSSKGAEIRTVFGIRGELAKLGVLGKGMKHLPDLYLRASYEQRLDLLRGIMDTDGHWNTTRQRAVLNTTNKMYAEQVYELVVSLGWTANIFKTVADGFGKKWDAWQLWFTPTGEKVFLARLPGNYRPTSKRPFRRIIKSVEKVETIETQCIEVDSDDHCFLAGEQMVKTHNTIRANLGPDDLRAKIQARIYAVAAAIQFKEEKPDIIWVEFDLLRYNPVSVKFSREELADTWRMMISEAERIIAAPYLQPPETLNPGCSWCVRKATCETLQKNIKGGGIHSVLGSGAGDPPIEKVMELYKDSKSQVAGLKALVEELDAFMLEYARNNDTFIWDAEANGVKLHTSTTSRGYRKISPLDVFRILGGKLFASYGRINIGDVDKLLDDPSIPDDKKEEIKAAIYIEQGSPSFKVEEKK